MATVISWQSARIQSAISMHFETLSAAAHPATQGRVDHLRGDFNDHSSPPAAAALQAAIPCESDQIDGIYNADPKLLRPASVTISHH